MFKVVKRCVCCFFFALYDNMFRKRAKSRRKDKTERKNSLEEPPSQPWGSYAEEIVPLPLVGRRPETDSGWLGSDAGEYCGETGEYCEAGVLSTCEPGETAESAVLAWLPNILSKRRRAPRCLPLPGWRAKGVGACGGMKSADELRCGPKPRYKRCAIHCEAILNGGGGSRVAAIEETQ